ncbi:MAG TPA: carbohydrate ABC transporter permease [Ruminiclostridium sp.]
MEGHILIALINSTIITAASVALIIIIASLSGYVLQRRKDKYSNFFNFLVLGGLIVPPAMVPTYWVLKLFNVNGTVLSVILMEAVLGFSFSVLIYKGFFTTIPKEIDEAALVDGCSGLRLFFTIIFPLLKPVTTTIAVIQAISIWNDFTIPMYFLSSSSNTTLPITVYMFFGKYQSSWNLVFADVVIIAIPMTIVYLLAQKYIIDGMTSGSLKG